MKLLKRCIFFLIPVFLFFSCASSPDAYREIDHAVSLNEFEAGIEAIRRGQSGRYPLYPERNAVSLFLDKGLLEHYAGNYRNSSHDLQEAERLIHEAFTKSITANITSYIANDNTKEYPGEDYEDIYINVFNALNYYHNNDLEGAMVEIRKITISSGKLDMLSRKYEAPGKSAGDWLLEQLREIGFARDPALPQGDPVNFSDSAMARYLGALFYQGQGKDDDARIEFDLLRSAFSSNSKVYYNPMPKAVEHVQNTPPEKTRLNILAFAGLSPVKEERIFTRFFPLFRNPALRYFQLKLPVFAKRPNSVDRIEVEVQGNGVFNLELLEDMGAVAEETYNARFANMYFKTYIRTFLKYAASDVAASKAEQQAEGLGGALLGLGTSVLAKAGADASENADIRMGRFFPGKAYIGGIDLDPGTYQITVTFYQQGRVIAKTEFWNHNVRENELNLIEAVCLK